MKKLKVLSYVFCIALLGSTQLHAQTTYPNKSIRLIVGFAPGGGSDILARALGQPLGEVLGQQIIIDNRPGAGGIIAAEVAKRATPDGHTLLLGSPGPFSISPNLMAKFPYDPILDFTPIGTFATLFYVVGVHPSLPVRSLRDLIALAKQKPGQVSFGSSGQGANIHLAIEQFSVAAGIKMTHVPYKGNAPMLTGLMGGEVAMVFDPVLTSLPLAKSGRIRALAVTSRNRSSLLPEIPTVSEAGVKNYESTNWFAIFAPAKTPVSIVERLNMAINQVMKNKVVEDRFISQGTQPAPSTPEELEALVKSELIKFANLIKSAHIKIQ